MFNYLSGEVFKPVKIRGSLVFHSHLNEIYQFLGRPAAGLPRNVAVRKINTTLQVVLTHNSK
jgi:hypothetical protein